MAAPAYDLSVFNESMRAIMAVPKRYGAEVVNSAVMKVLIGSGSGPGLVQLTPKAEKQQILNDLTQNGLIYRLAGKALARTPYTGSRKKALDKMVVKILNARVRSRAYIAAGWLVSARKLRRYVRGNLSRLGSDTKVLEKGEAAKSFVVPAGGDRLSGGAYNTADGAKIVSPDSLVQTTINNATMDHLIYIQRKFGSAISDAINNGHSAESVLPI